jgi:hypothetical protein
MKMMLKALMWNDIYTYTYSQKAYDIYRVIFCDAKSRDEKSKTTDENGYVFEKVDVEFIDSRGVCRKIVYTMRHEPAGKSDVIVSVNENGMVVIRHSGRFGFLRYDEDDSKFDRWRSHEELKEFRRHLMGRVKSFENWLRKTLADKAIELDGYALSSMFKFKLKDKDVFLSVNEVESLFYLIENEGRISWRGAEKRGEALLREIRGEETDMIYASCMKLLRDGWRVEMSSVHGMLHGRFASLYTPASLNLRTGDGIKRFNETMCGLRDRLISLVENFGYSASEVIEELRFESENGLMTGFL